MLCCSSRIHVASLMCVTCFSAGYIYDFASSASKKLSESVVETAQTLKKSVEEGKINGMIDKVNVPPCLSYFTCFHLPVWPNDIFSSLRPFWGISRKNKKGLFRNKQRKSPVSTK